MTNFEKIAADPRTLARYFRMNHMCCGCPAEGKTNCREHSNKGFRDLCELNWVDYLESEAKSK